MNVQGGAGVQTACGSFAEERSTEPPSVADRHGHETVHGIYDFSLFRVLVSMRSGSPIIVWGSWSIGLG